MSTVQEIEAAIKRLPREEFLRLHDRFQRRFDDGYLIIMAFALRKNFCARRVHQYFSAIFVPIGLIVVIAILGPGKMTTWFRAGMAFAAFILIGGLYKYALAKFGTALFGEEIRE